MSSGALRAKKEAPPWCRWNKKKHLPHLVSEPLGNQQLAGCMTFLPLWHKQKEGGRAGEGSPGGCQSRFKWRQAACLLWTGPPPPVPPPLPSRSLFLGLTGIPLLVTLFWGNRWHARPTLLQSHSWWGGNADLWLRLLTQDYVYASCSPSTCLLSWTKGASECLLHASSTGY